MDKIVEMSNPIILYANGHPECEVREIERYHSGSKEFIMYEFSEPIELVNGISYEVGREDTTRRSVTPNSFQIAMPRCTFLLH